MIVAVSPPCILEECPPCSLHVRRCPMLSSMSRVLRGPFCHHLLSTPSLDYEHKRMRLPERNGCRCAMLAREAGYDGVEVMGSEGYLINQFLVEHTNKRRVRRSQHGSSRRYLCHSIYGHFQRTEDANLCLFRASRPSRFEATVGTATAARGTRWQETALELVQVHQE